MTISKPPVGPDVRAAIVTLLNTDIDVLNWYGGTNFESETYERDVGAYMFLGEVKDMSLRVEIVDVVPEDGWEHDCLKYDVMFNVWVYYTGGSDDLPSNLLGLVETLLKGLDTLTQSVVDSRTVVLRGIRFRGRGTVQTMFDMWRIPANFSCKAYYA